MSAVRSRRPWRRPAVLAAALAALLVVAAWLVLRGGDDPDELAPLRGAPGVAAVAEEDDGVAVRLRPGTGTGRIAAALERTPDDADRTTLRLGRALLEVQADTTPDPELLDAFVALAGTRAAGGTLRIERVSSGDRVEVEVPRPEQAAPLAREILTRLTPGGRAVAGIDGVEVSLAGAPQADVPPVLLRRLGGRDGRLEAAVLDAAVALGPRRPRVSTGGDDGELRVRADGVGDAAAAWRAATGALDLPAAQRRDVEVYVDVVDVVGEREGTRALLSGRSASSPDRALALLRALPAAASDTFAATDLSYATAQAPGPRAAEAVAAAARSAGVRRLELGWPAGADRDASDDASSDDERSGGPSVARIEDAPGTVLGLLPGIARAHRLGIDEVRWSATDSGATLQVAPPAWVDPGKPLTDHPALLRRFARAIRAIGWPGTARVALPLGRGTCDGFEGAQGVARISSTAGGRARSVEPGGACTNAGAVAAARRGGQATAG